jgi:hypothetical protein
MAQATESHTPADSWRQHRVRQRANGKGKHPMPHGRYSATKKTLHNGVVARPALTALEELCVLSIYADGFTFTPQMEAACQRAADKLDPAAIAACLARADIRERAVVRR